jgi:hypothetical protein
MSGKGGKASKKVWEWGRTSAANLADPLDYAHEAIITRAGYIGVKVGAWRLGTAGTSSGAGAHCLNGATVAHSVYPVLLPPASVPASGLDQVQALAHGTPGAAQQPLECERGAGAGHAIPATAKHQQQRVVGRTGAVAAAAAQDVAGLQAWLRPLDGQLAAASASSSRRGQQQQ